MNMFSSVHSVPSFPAISLPSKAGGAPVEVALIAQLGIGAGDRLIAQTGSRQALHPEFVDALDEPSTRLGAMHLAHGDASSLYSFVVGAGGHPFHRHATPRTFTAISGSSGAELRFCTVGDAALSGDASAFIEALHLVTIPPDCMFTVRFGRGTWHQFVSRHPAHPALFALSCHTNELAGELSEAQRAQVLANDATIPALTETLPSDVARLLERTDLRSVPQMDLALHAPPASLLGRLCTMTRDVAGRLRQKLHRNSAGYLGHAGSQRKVTSSTMQPENSLLWEALPAAGAHDDCVSLTLDKREVGQSSANQLLARVLEGFIENRPSGVSRLMHLRNVAVAPMKLRTSPMGCPVSSLLSNDRSQLFEGRFPVLGQRVNTNEAKVLLGADDRHLVFRSCVSVKLREDGSAMISLGTRVRTRNVFGMFYMQAIALTHRRYVAPALLRMAVDHAMTPDFSTYTMQMGSGLSESRPA